MNTFYRGLKLNALFRDSSTSVAKITKKPPRDFENPASYKWVHDQNHRIGKTSMKSQIMEAKLSLKICTNAATTTFTRKNKNH